MTKTLFVNGDSWTFGSEIIAPEFLVDPSKAYSADYKAIREGADYHPDNDYYRIPRIWPTHLGRLLQFDNVVNLSWPARSNDTIYKSTVHWLMENYILPQKDTSDLIVVIGWSSPERKNVVFEDLDGQLHEYTIWPAMAETKFYEHPMVKRYFEFHVMHLWTHKETITRFIEQNFALHQLCKQYNIRHYFFNSFYVPREGAHDFSQWKDINLRDVISDLHSTHVRGWKDKLYSDDNEISRLINMWDMIPEQNFINKTTCASFKRYAEENVNSRVAWCGIHPSPESHEAWAHYLHSIIGKPHV